MSGWNARMAEEIKKKPEQFANTPTVDEISNVMLTLGLDKTIPIFRQIATLAWSRGSKKAREE